MKAAWALSIRDIHVRLLECSASGCLLESSLPLAPGTTARLRLTLDRRNYVEQVEIVRCQNIAGTSAYHLAARFLPTVAQTHASLRLALRRRTPEDEAILAAQTKDRPARKKSGPDKPSAPALHVVRSRRSR